MTTILVTGFEPFDRETVNPSWEVARRLDGWRCDGHVVAARLLPCAFDAVLPALDRHIGELAPEIAICVGQAGGRVEMSVERVAINVVDARIPDNHARQPVDVPVVAGGPPAYFSTLPIKATVARLRAAGIPAGVSNTAGTFVCNHAFYVARHLAATTRPGLRRTGFIHIPYLPEQAARHPGAASMSVETLLAGIRIAIEAALDVEGDIALQAGATH